MVTPCCAFVPPSLAMAEAVPDGVHLGQARLVKTTAPPRQFLFDAPEAVFEFGNGLTQALLSAQV
jgi:hypothetical protein